MKVTCVVIILCSRALSLIVCSNCWDLFLANSWLLKFVGSELSAWPLPITDNLESNPCSNLDLSLYSVKQQTHCACQLLIEENQLQKPSLPKGHPFFFTSTCLSWKPDGLRSSVLGFRLRIWTTAQSTSCLLLWSSRWSNGSLDRTTYRRNSYADAQHHL